jgi:hypothetical protein
LIETETLKASGDVILCLAAEKKKESVKWALKTSSQTSIVHWSFSYLYLVLEIDFSL